MSRPASDVHAFEAHATGADLDDLRARLAADHPTGTLSRRAYVRR